MSVLVDRIVYLRDDNDGMSISITTRKDTDPPGDDRIFVVRDTDSDRAIVFVSRGDLVTFRDALQLLIDTTPEPGEEWRPLF